MVSFFFLFQIKGERRQRPPFIGKGRHLSLVYFQCRIASHKGRNPKPPNLGSTNMPIFDRVHECNEHEQ